MLPIVCDRVSVLARIADDNFERAILLVELRRRFPANGHLDDVQHIAHVHAMARDLGPVDVDGKVRLSIDPFHHQVRRAPDFAEHGADLFGLSS